MEQKMKLTKDIIDAVIKKIDGSAIVSEDKTLSFPHIYNVSEVADSTLKLLVEYEKQVRISETEYWKDVIFSPIRQAKKQTVSLADFILRIKELEKL